MRSRELLLSSTAQNPCPSPLLLSVFPVAVCISCLCMKFLYPHSVHTLWDLSVQTSSGLWGRILALPLEAGTSCPGSTTFKYCLCSGTQAWDTHSCLSGVLQGGLAGMPLSASRERCMADSKDAHLTLSPGQGDATAWRAR